MTTERQEYAARSQASHVFPGEQQEYMRPGKRVGQGGKNESQVFSGSQDQETMQQDGSRTKPRPAPFLTDSNAVDTHNRLGGFVEQNDSLLDIDGNVNGRDMGRLDNGEDKMADFNENARVARTHKHKQNTSHIFQSPEAAQNQGNQPKYQPRNMSNVF